MKAVQTSRDVTVPCDIRALSTTWTSSVLSFSCLVFQKSRFLHLHATFMHCLHNVTALYFHHRHTQWASGCLYVIIRPVFVSFKTTLMGLNMINFILDPFITGEKVPLNPKGLLGPPKCLHSQRSFYTIGSRNSKQNHSSTYTHLHSPSPYLEKEAKSTWK